MYEDKKEPRDVRFMVRVEQELDTWLEDLKKKHNISKSSLVRIMILESKKTGFVVDIK